MSEPSDSDMILATSCPHCGTECEFDLPAEATTNAELAGQIRVVCHGCEEMFQPVGDAIAGSEDIADALERRLAFVFVPDIGKGDPALFAVHKQPGLDQTDFFQIQPARADPF